MHLSEDHRKEAEKNHVNVVIAGHIASDNLGLNLLFDHITESGELIILECSGFRRVIRN
jgi:putative NIF3 family GTP cyclohydrolase 1 type 2